MPCRVATTLSSLAAVERRRAAYTTSVISPLDALAGHLPRTAVFLSCLGGLSLLRIFHHLLVSVVIIVCVCHPPTFCGLLESLALPALSLGLLKLWCAFNAWRTAACPRSDSQQTCETYNRPGLLLQCMFPFHACLPKEMVVWCFGVGKNTERLVFFIYFFHLPLPAVRCGRACRGQPTALS